MQISLCSNTATVYMRQDETKIKHNQQTLSRDIKTQSTGTQQIHKTSSLELVVLGERVMNLRRTREVTVRGGRYVT